MLREVVTVVSASRALSSRCFTQGLSHLLSQLPKGAEQPLPFAVFDHFPVAFLIHGSALEALSSRCRSKLRNLQAVSALKALSNTYRDLTAPHLLNLSFKGTEQPLQQEIAALSQLQRR